MRYAFKLAFKNLINQKRRTVLTFAMLAFGIALYIFIAGMLEGFDLKSFENLIETQTAHLKIRSIQYSEDMPFDTDNFIKNRDAVESVLKKYKFIKAYTPRMVFLGEADNMIDSTAVIINAVDLKRDPTVFNLGKYIDGSFEPSAAVLGSELAEGLGLEKDSSFFLTFRNKQGMVTSIEYYVSGLIYSGDQRINSSTVYIPLKEAYNYMNTDDVSEYALTVDNLENASKYKAELKKTLKNMNIETWEEMAEDFTAIVQTKKKGTAFILLFILVIAMVGIINTMIMSVYEKKSEIGTLKALGMTDRQLKYMFIFEGLMIGLGGSICGIVLGTIMNMYFAVEGLDWTAFMGADTSAGMGIYVVGKIKSTWPIGAYVSSVALSIICSVLASYYPAKKVMKMEPVDCLRIIQ